MSKISDLSKGLLLLDAKKETGETAYTAMGRITKNRNVVSRRHQYSNDLERVIRETKLTLSLSEEINKEVKIGGEIYSPEQVIIYYNGIFLDQVHQIKDKLFRLVDRLLTDPEQVQDNQKKDPKEIKYKPFLDKYKIQLQEIGIFELLESWGSGTFAVVLNKRTEHHHRVSTLPLNDDFQKIRMSRTMLSPSGVNQLSEYGKKKMTEIGEESFKKWKDDTIKKQQSTLHEIEQNIDEIANKLVSYFKVPTDPKECADIVNNWVKSLESLDIHNEASINKIDPAAKEILDDFVNFAKNTFPAKIASIYLVGSCGRGEYIPGTSDVNLYVITSGTKFGGYSDNGMFPMNVTFLSKEEFFSPSYKKDRFICWSDGVLLYGEDLKFDKKEFPKPGTFLCLLLNRGFIEELEKIKTEVASLSRPTPIIMRQFTLKAVRIVMDFDFGVAMSNWPFYTASRERKLAYTKQMWPKERRTTTLEQIYKTNNSLRKEDFPMLIDTFLENARKNYKKLLEIEAEINKDNK